MLTFNVSDFLSKPIGSVQERDINEALVFESQDRLNPASNMTGKVFLYRVDGAISAYTENLNMDFNVQCSKCLKNIKAHVIIPNAERLFYINPKDTEEDLSEGDFTVDMRRKEIGLFEMVRQEILLHFPAYPLCYESCKGLCAYCGQNLNEKPCMCSVKKQPESTNPFSALKRYI